MEKGSQSKPEQGSLDFLSGEERKKLLIKKRLAGVPLSEEDEEFMREAMREEREDDQPYHN